MALTRIITREQKGAPLTSEELDANFLALQQSITLNVPAGFYLNLDPAAYDGTGELILDTNVIVSNINLFNSMGNANLKIGSLSGSIDLKNNVVVDKFIADGSDPFVIKFQDQEIFSVDTEGNTMTVGRMVANMLVLTIHNEPPNIIQGGIFTDGDEYYVGLE